MPYPASLLGNPLCDLLNQDETADEANDLVKKAPDTTLEDSDGNAVAKAEQCDNATPVDVSISEQPETHKKEDIITINKIPHVPDIRIHKHGQNISKLCEVGPLKISNRGKSIAHVKFWHLAKRHYKLCSKLYMLIGTEMEKFNILYLNFPCTEVRKLLDQ